MPNVALTTVTDPAIRTWLCAPHVRDIPFVTINSDVVELWYSDCLRSLMIGVRVVVGEDWVKLIDMDATLVLWDMLANADNKQPDI